MAEDLTGRLGFKFDRGVQAYHDDPAGFATECVMWPKGRRTGSEGGPTEYQLEVLSAIVKHERVAVRGPRGLGKTTEAALAILWFALTRDAAQEDWKCIVTAGAWGQLVNFLWPEVRTKIASRLDWSRIGRKPFDMGTELMQRELRLRFGAVSMGAPSDAAKIEGAHADELFYVLDEAKSIPDDTWHSIEGAFSGAGEETDQVAYALASSTPGTPEGVFYDIHARAPGYEDWHPIHVPLERVLKAGRLARKWVEQRREQFGEDSAWYQNHVEGEFAREAKDGVISMRHLEEAHERWRELGLPGKPTQQTLQVPVHDSLMQLDVIGADLAEGGADRTVFALRHANVISTLILRPREPDIMVPTGEIKALTEFPERPAWPVVDANGIGGPCVARLREQGVNVLAFIAQEKTTARMRATGQYFVDVRGAAWWNLRELLEPTSGMELAIPPDDQLTADLLAPTWKTESNGRVRVESKKDIRKRLKRSTDAGDSVVQAFWAHRNAASLRPPEVLKRPGGSRWSALKQTAGASRFGM